MTTATADITGLINQAAKFAGYRKYTYDSDRNVPGVQGRATVAEATELVRAHVAADSRLRNIEVANYGAITLHQGDTHIRLEPGMDAHPRRLTKRQAEDLVLIAHNQHRAKLTHEPGKGWTVHAGMWRIPPAATETLIKHGWIATGGYAGDPVTVSLAGTVALNWRYLKGEKVPAGHWGEEIAESIVDVFAA